MRQPVHGKVVTPPSIGHAQRLNSKHRGSRTPTARPPMSDISSSLSDERIALLSGHEHLKRIPYISGERSTKMKYCCCCISLRVGTVTMGILNLIGSIAGIILITPAISSIQVIRVEHRTVVNPPSDGVNILNEYYPPNQGFRSTDLLTYAIAVGVLIYMLVTVLTSALMVYGALRRVSHCVFPWLALNFASNVYLACAILTFAIINTIYNARAEYLIICAGTALGTALNFFLWLAVFSYYQELAANELQHRTQPHIGKIISPPPVYTTYIQ